MVRKGLIPACIAVIPACIAALAFAASAGAATRTLKASSGPLRVTFTPPATHTPKENANVWITVVATVNGKPAQHATAYYQFLFAGQVVSTQYVRNNKHFSFNGHFRDNLVFPASAVGEPLTVRFVVKGGGRTVHFDWAIKTEK
jgi:hypothetical protein